MSVIKPLHLRLPHPDQTEVHCYILARGDRERPLVVFSHGFNVPGFESGRLFIELSGLLIERGCDAVLFDYRGSGYSSMSFSDMTFASEVADLRLVLGHFAKQLRPSSTFVWGVSFGCAVAAHALRGNDLQVDAAVYWSFSADLYERYKRRLGEEILQRGEVFIPAGFIVRRAFLDSLEGIDTYADVAAFKKHVLLVHGTADDVASVELSRSANAISPANTSLVEIPGGTHGFKNQPEERQEAVAKTFDWLSERRVL